MERSILALLWLLASIVSGVNAYLADTRDYAHAWGVWALMCLIFSICYNRNNNNKKGGVA